MSTQDRYHPAKAVSPRDYIAHHAPAMVTGIAVHVLALWAMASSWITI